MTDIPKEIAYEILPDDYTQYDLSFKIIVIGDSGVGKSCLTNKATKNIFNDNYNATVGFEFFTFNVRISDKIIKLQIWDTCGQELYRSLITNFYRNSSLALIVFAVNNRESFDDIDMWLRELRTHSNPDVKIFLIGNKIDLEDERKITKGEAEEYAKNNNLNKYVETSAKTGINAQDTFIDVAYLLYEDYLKYKDEDKEDISYDGESIRSRKETAKSIKSLDTPVAKVIIKNKEKSGCCGK